MMRPTKRRFEKPVSEKQRQWLWFVGLFFGGMAGMLVLAGLVRVMIGMGR